MDFKNKKIVVLIQEYLYLNTSKVLSKVNETLLQMPYNEAFDYATMMCSADVDHQDEDAIGEFRDIRGGVIRKRITLFNGIGGYVSMCEKYGIKPGIV